tara:strand:+ start:6312 stop:6863 length:552 start_codon:yes stop_codon:yes gene_type:complete
MSNYEEAFNYGRTKAVEDLLEKTGGAVEDATLILKALASGGKGAANLGTKAVNQAKKIGKGAKYLGTVSDPRHATILGALGLAGGVITPAAIAAAKSKNLPDAILSAIKAGGPGLLAAGSAGIAAGANPGLFGGSMGNRLTHELAMQSRTPAGLIATMASVAGIPAAIYAFGKMRGREENSIF